MIFARDFISKICKKWDYGYNKINIYLVLQKMSKLHKSSRDKHDHLINIANTLENNYKFSPDAVKEVTDTLIWETTDNMYLLNKEEKGLVNTVYAIYEDIDSWGFSNYLNELYTNNNELYQKTRAAVLKEKNHTIKLLERAILDHKNTKTKIVELQWSLLGNISIIKAFSKLEGKSISHVHLNGDLST